MMRSRFATLFLLACALVLLPGCSAMPDKEIKFPSVNFECRIPYFWILRNNPMYVLDAHRFTGGMFAVVAKPMTHPFHVTPNFGAALRKNLVRDGYTIMSESDVAFRSEPAYTVIIKKIINGKLIFCRSINFTHGKIRYAIELSIPNSDPGDDEGLMTALSSFRFLNDVP